MKRFYMIFAVAAMAALTLLSCEKYEDGKPAKSVRSEFAEMYPDARDVEWEAEAGYWKVSFETGKAPAVQEHEAWYDASGNWIRTETDLVASALPQSVKDALAASEYASAILSGSDIEYVETPDGNYYEIEVRYGGVEVALKVTEGGEVSLAFPTI